MNLVLDPQCPRTAFAKCSTVGLPLNR
jgi:hypothetical protein